MLAEHIRSAFLADMRGVRALVCAYKRWSFMNFGVKKKGACIGRMVTMDNKKYEGSENTPHINREKRKGRKGLYIAIPAYVGSLAEAKKVPIRKREKKTYVKTYGGGDSRLSRANGSPFP
eukprot:1143795-Pelagomonas_calceolata.AAC.1